MADFNSARCDVLDAELLPYGKEGKKPINIADMVGSFTIAQSIDQVSLTGSIDVLDGVGLLENMPLRGEESLFLKIKCYDLDTEINLKTRIYKIEGVGVTDTIKQTIYTLHFVSETSFNAGLRRFISAFREKPSSTIAKEIFQKYFGTITPYVSDKTVAEKLPEGSLKYDLVDDKSVIEKRKRNFYIEQTKRNLHVTIPNYTPTEAMSFLCRRTFRNDGNTASSFRFFENYDGYFFVSDEWLTERGAKNVLPNTPNKNIFVYNPYSVVDPLYADEQIRSLISFSNPKRVDVGKELGGGAYKNTVIEYDLLRHSINTTTYDYNNSKKGTVFTGMKGNSAKADIHTKDFIDNIFTPENSKRFVIFKDFTNKESGSGQYKNDMNIKEIAARRTMYHHHLNATMVSAATRGRLDLQAGQVIDVRITQADNGLNEQQNKNLSGKYLIHSLIHKMQDGDLTTSMNLIKYDWTDAEIDTSEGIIA